VPILQAMRGAGLSNLVLVVTRYFGGIKLGRGGLARAYRHAANGVLEGAAIVETRTRISLEIDVPIERVGAIRHLLARHGGRVDTARYDVADRAVFEVTIPEEALQRLGEDLESLTRGEARIRTGG
jgi:putative IMPACT (imprinted ancient) family translation regulator